eukprot:scaffold25329_cov135-Amphora_coffeaeformis.AAC.1
MFMPQFLRASSHRAYAVLVRKTSNNPNDGMAREKGAMGRDSCGRVVAPNHHVCRFHATKAAAMDVTLMTYRKMFL